MSKPGIGFYFFMQDFSCNPDLDGIIGFSVCEKTFFDTNKELDCVFFANEMPEDYDQSGSSFFMVGGKSSEQVRQELIEMGFEENMAN